MLYKFYNVDCIRNACIHSKQIKTLRRDDPTWRNVCCHWIGRKTWTQWRHIKQCIRATSVGKTLGVHECYIRLLPTFQGAALMRFQNFIIEYKNAWLDWLAHNLYYVRWTNGIDFFLCFGHSNRNSKQVHQFRLEILLLCYSVIRVCSKVAKVALRVRHYLPTYSHSCL